MKPIDIFKSLLLCRDNELNQEHVIIADENKDVAGNKKRFNIPICNIQEDLSYELDVPSTFEIPISYLRYNKKIGDEIDVTIDYIADADDKKLISNYQKSANEKELKLLTVDSFETIINNFEKSTGYAKDPIPMSQAIKIISEQFHWESSTSSHMTSTLYEYWVNKRASIGKPLCRRYWPQVTSVDTNPYQVFRVRDREKYRLRKVQKRNDVESFRKMQKLRKEFRTASNILKLIMEREKLLESDFILQEQIFQEKLYVMMESYKSDAMKSHQDDTQQPEIASVQGLNQSPDETISKAYFLGSRTSPHIHTATCDYLLDMIDNEQSELEQSHALTMSSSRGTSHRSSRKSISQISSNVDLTNADMDIPNSLSVSKMKKNVNQDDKKLTKRRRDTRERVILYTINADGATVPMEAVTVRTSTGSTFNVLDSTGQNPSVPLGDPSGLMKIIHPKLEGPSTVCQPLWPSFMEPSSMRQVYLGTHRSLSDYIEELEFKENLPLPCKFRCRNRIGRGGRLIIDRIPVYDRNVTQYGSPVDQATDNTSPTHAQHILCPPKNEFAFVYPTSLHSHLPTLLHYTMNHQDVAPMVSTNPTGQAPIKQTKTMKQNQKSNHSQIISSKSATAEIPSLGNQSSLAIGDGLLEIANVPEKVEIQLRPIESVEIEGHRMDNNLPVSDTLNPSTVTSPSGSALPEFSPFSNFLQPLHPPHNVINHSFNKKSTKPISKKIKGIATNLGEKPGIGRPGIVGNQSQVNALNHMNVAMITPPCRSYTPLDSFVSNHLKNATNLKEFSEEKKNKSIRVGGTVLEEYNLEKLKAIYEQSDSEDEKVFVPRSAKIDHVLDGHSIQLACLQHQAGSNYNNSVLSKNAFLTRQHSLREMISSIKSTIHL